MCAIVKGVYIVQLRSEDFSYNGKDVTIWTAVETAVAIIGASLPVLRVLVREKVSSYGASRGASRRATATRSVRLEAVGKGGGDRAWVRIERGGEESRE